MASKAVDWEMGDVSGMVRGPGWRPGSLRELLVALRWGVDHAVPETEWESGYYQGKEQVLDEIQDFIAEHPTVSEGPECETCGHPITAHGEESGQVGCYGKGECGCPGWGRV